MLGHLWGFAIGQRVAFRVATKSETIGAMTTYEPDPQTAKLFAQHKTAAQTVKRTRKPVLTAAEDAIRAGATNQQLAELTGMSDETFRKLAEKIGVDNRQKAPTVGREVEARRAAPEHAPPAE